MHPERLQESWPEPQLRFLSLHDLPNKGQRNRSAPRRKASGVICCPQKIFSCSFSGTKTLESRCFIVLIDFSGLLTKKAPETISWTYHPNFLKHAIIRGISIRTDLAFRNDLPRVRKTSNFGKIRWVLCKYSWNQNLAISYNGSLKKSSEIPTNWRTSRACAKSFVLTKNSLLIPVVGCRSCYPHWNCS